MVRFGDRPDKSGYSAFSWHTKINGRKSDSKTLTIIDSRYYSIIGSRGNLLARS